MCCQNGRNERRSEEIAHFFWRDAGRFDAVEGMADAAFLGGIVGERGVPLLTDVVLVFGDVGQVEKVAEGPDHRNHGVARQRVEQLVERLALRFVL